MSTTFRPYVPDQSLLLPPDVREWLPEGHLAHHVSDLVDGLDRAHSRFPGHALTPTGVMAIRCKQFHLPDL